MKRHSHSLAKPYRVFYSAEAVSSAAVQEQVDLVIPDECDKIDIDSLESAANQNDVKAQLLLADCYYYGRGMSKKREGRIKRDLQKAFSYWSKAADQENAKAQCCLGYCYWYGEGVTENKEAAVSWYQKASNQRDMIAEYCLATIYLDGNIVPSNKEEAISLYRKSAEQGYPLARKRLEELEQQS